jgi:transposase
MRITVENTITLFVALASMLIIGQAERFGCGKQVASYLGLVPLEDSSGNRRRLGHITKQGRSMMRFLLVEAAKVTVRSVPKVELVIGKLHEWPESEARETAG